MTTPSRFVIVCSVLFTLTGCDGSGPHGAGDMDVSNDTSEGDQHDDALADDTSDAGVHSDTDPADTADQSDASDLPDTVELPPIDTREGWVSELQMMGDGSLGLRETVALNDGGVLVLVVLLGDVTFPTQTGDVAASADGDLYGLLFTAEGELHSACRPPGYNRRTRTSIYDSGATSRPWTTAMW